MVKLLGTIVTEPNSDNGRCRFILVLENPQKRVACVTAAGFEETVPNAGTIVVVVGEHKLDVISGGESFDFCVNHIESQ